MGKLSIPQVVLAGMGLIGITILSIQGTVSADAVIAIYSAVIGGALGYVNGQKTNQNQLDRRVHDLETRDK